MPALFKPKYAPTMTAAIITTVSATFQTEIGVLPPALPVLPFTK